jgi:hypothetical protein
MIKHFILIYFCLFCICLNTKGQGNKMRFEVTDSLTKFNVFYSVNPDIQKEELMLYPLNRILETTQLYDLRGNQKLQTILIVGNLHGAGESGAHFTTGRIFELENGKYTLRFKNPVGNINISEYNYKGVYSFYNTYGVDFCEQIDEVKFNGKIYKNTPISDCGIPSEIIQIVREDKHNMIYSVIYENAKKKMYAVSYYLNRFSEEKFHSIIECDKKQKKCTSCLENVKIDSFYSRKSKKEPIIQLFGSNKSFYDTVNTTNILSEIKYKKGHYTEKKLNHSYQNEAINAYFSCKWYLCHDLEISLLYNEKGLVKYNNDYVYFCNPKENRSIERLPSYVYWNGSSWVKTKTWKLRKTENFKVVKP